MSGGEVTASEPEAALRVRRQVSSGGIIGVRGAHSEETRRFHRELLQARGAVYVGSGGVFYMEGPTKFIENEVTETQGVRFAVGS